MCRHIAIERWFADIHHFADFGDRMFAFVIQLAFADSGLMILVYLPISHAIEQQLPQAEPQPEQSEQLEQTQPKLKLCHDIIDDSERIIIDDPKIETKPTINKNLSHVSDWNR